jgi:arsenate reductase
MKILILCTGNSCRSQMAEGFLTSFDSKLEVHSAGTKPTEEVNPRAIEVMKEVGIDLSQNKPQDVRKYLDEAWDYVITVCGGANESCPAFVGKVQHRLHIGFDDPAAIEGEETHIMNEFRRIRNEIKNRFYAFYIQEIKKQELPKCSCSEE